MKFFSTCWVVFTLFSVPAFSKPNVILVVADNLGYGDVGCFGSKVNRTPNLDKMAAEGIKLTGFYVGSSVCTPSRAAFMTGCYPARVSMEMSGTRRVVIQPVAQKGLAPGETTMAEVLKKSGYATMCIGKWHLGDQLPFLPTRQGFDQWLGVPYSEDMIATTAPRLGEMWPPVPLVKNETVIEAPVDPNTLTKTYTEAAVAFIKENRKNPFFLYLPHAVPGSSKTAFASKEFREKSQNGIYGACIEELDWSMGEIFNCLKTEGLDENTIVVWTSDNGAFQGRREQPFGQNTPLRGTGGTAYEGGFRVPCIVRWPGRIPAGIESRELVTSMDLLPTFATLAGQDFQPERKIDGKDIWPVLAGKSGASSPHSVFFYYRISQLRAVRSGKWKLHLPVNRNGFSPPRPAVFDKIQLYDLEADLSETTNLAQEHPEIVSRLTELAKTGSEALGDLNRPGTEQRPAGWMDNVTALRLPRFPSARGFPSDSAPLVGQSLGFSRFEPETTEGWATSSSVSLNVDNPAELHISPLPGDTVLYHTGNSQTALTSTGKFTDLKLHLEFLTAAQSSFTISLADGLSVSLPASHPAGEWQSIDIEIDETKASAKLNGATLFEKEISPPQVSTPIAIQCQKGPMALRNVWIKK